MISFVEFFKEQNNSREGQIAQFQNSLLRLSKSRKSLSANGIDTTNIDDQIQQVNNALHRRLSATHKWHGAIVRIDQEPINSVLMWRLTTKSGLVFHIPVSATKGVVKIPNNWQQFPSSTKPMNKFIEYREEPFGSSVLNLITYAENRTVDVVPFRTNKNSAEYYLIKRRGSGMWATVGGHVEEGELNNPLVAAMRELQEETQATAMVMKKLPIGWVRESVRDSESTPSADYNSWTLPFLAIVNPSTQMVPSDDAIGGDWFKIGSIPKGLHFEHHEHIINSAFEYLPQFMKEYGKH